MNVKDLKIYGKLANKKAIKVVALGSSNTQRFDVGMHWFDFVELGFKNVYGGSCGQFINSGITNNSCNDLLLRFDDQVKVYKPDLTIVTVGINDILQKFSESEFTNNLLKLNRRLKEINSDVVFQTYYACKLETIKSNYPELAEKIPVYMQLLRDAACKCDAPLIDQFVRWERLRLRDYDGYLELMRDSLHVNANGNMLMGLEAMKFFGNQLRFDQIDYCKDGLALQYKLNVLERNLMDFEGRVIE